MSSLLTADNLGIMLSKADNEYNSIDLSVFAKEYGISLKDLWQAVDRMAFAGFVEQMTDSETVRMTIGLHRQIKAIKLVNRHQCSNLVYINYVYQMVLSDNEQFYIDMPTTSVYEAYMKRTLALFKATGYTSVASYHSFLELHKKLGVSND